MTDTKNYKRGRSTNEIRECIKALLGDWQPPTDDDGDTAPVELSRLSMIRVLAIRLRVRKVLTLKIDLSIAA